MTLSCLSPSISCISPSARATTSVCLRSTQITGAVQLQVVVGATLRGAGGVAGGRWQVAGDRGTTLASDSART